MGAAQASAHFERAAESDVEQLMRWFPDAASTRAWGGPFFRHPFDDASFREDLRWGRMASFALRSDAGELLAFGQCYERYGRMNLARLAVSPAQRGRGLGRRFIATLMDAARSELSLDEFSLFVYRDNHPALRCYSSLGFRPADYPEGAPLAGEAIYMLRRADAVGT
ncbi:MAG: GNAT family N-acetyltransferase [Gammaproteobacteria bacterium]|nr:GNAT family N-acetyltransferase [Gammaproteobacteria bacterium]MDH4254481.1 GNAT family N-acetyltransferase [Gammaproteobacteria bacterium]MDH5309085.1 GNAT family N-acetyltransferase [Gammaproteobacteria bacterium]